MENNICEHAKECEQYKNYVAGSLILAKTDLVKRPITVAYAGQNSAPKVYCAISRQECEHIAKLNKMQSGELKKVLEGSQMQTKLEDCMQETDENSATQAEIRETFKNTILD